MSVVLRFGRNSRWASGRFSSEMLVMRQLRMTRTRIFPAKDRREMARYLVSLTVPVLEQGDECGIPELCGHILHLPDAGEE